MKTSKLLLVFVIAFFAFASCSENIEGTEEVVVACYRNR